MITPLCCRRPIDQSLRKEKLGVKIGKYYGCVNDQIDSFEIQFVFLKYSAVFSLRTVLYSSLFINPCVESEKPEPVLSWNDLPFFLFS